jgi:hypothetical protein
MQRCALIDGRFARQESSEHAGQATVCTSHAWRDHAQHGHDQACSSCTVEDAQSADRRKVKRIGAVDPAPLHTTLEGEGSEHDEHPCRESLIYIGRDQQGIKNDLQITG